MTKAEDAAQAKRDKEDAIVSRLSEAGFSAAQVLALRSVFSQKR